MEMIIVKYIHLLCFLFFASTLFLEYFLIKEKMNNENFKVLCKADIFYGLSALSIFVAGIALWFFVGKDSTFYSSNYLFHIKITLFILIGLLSIYPTLFFFKNRDSTDNIIEVPKLVIILIKYELLLLCIVPLLAVLVVNGYGLSS